MSAVGGSQRRPAALLYAAAVAFAVGVALASYLLLVVREKQIGEKANVVAEKLKEEIDRANRYLDSHKNDGPLRRGIEETTAEVKRRIPRGPTDITVGSYIERAARDLQIEDLKWSIQGGIKPPSTPAQEDNRLAVDPATLKASLIDVGFTARYKDALKLLKALSAEENAAPWPIEITSLEVKRSAGGEKGYKVVVTMTARYLFQ
jgi:hypothetical protein